MEARQGYYIKADSEQDAIAQMAERFSYDEADFTAQLWKIDCPVCRGQVSCHLCGGAGRVEVNLIEAYDQAV